MSLLLMLLLFVHIGSTVADTNVFDDLPSSGPTNPIYSIGEVVQISWSMNFTGAKLTLGQDKAGDKVGGANAVIRENTNLQALSWTVSYEGLDPRVSHVFYFTVSNDEDSFSSHYFYIFNEQPQDASVSSTTTTLTTSASISTSTSPTAASSASSQATTTPSSNSTGLSGGGIAGVTIVATLGTVAVLGAAGFFIRRWLMGRRGVAAPGMSENGTGWLYPGDNDAMTPTSRSPRFGDVPIAELHGHRRQY
ncbi:auxilin-like clathrin-binding protein required for normal clathrin function [Hypoxylon texense]